MTSLMEQRVREKGWNRPAKPVPPESFENAQAEVAFLKACEGYSRQTIQLCLEQITNEKAWIEQIQAKRLKLEQLFIPVSKPPKAVRLPGKIAKMVNDAGQVSNKELDEMIRLLEQLAEEGE